MCELKRKSNASSLGLRIQFISMCELKENKHSLKRGLLKIQFISMCELKERDKQSKWYNDKTKLEKLIK